MNRRACLSKIKIREEHKIKIILVHSCIKRTQTDLHFLQKCTLVYHDHLEFQGFLQALLFYDGMSGTIDFVTTKIQEVWF